MKVSLAYVTSLNGLITDGDNPDVAAWSSPEDAAHFKRLRDQADAIIMGCATYQQVQPEPQPGKLRFVYTSRPEEFADKAVTGQLEFGSPDPAQLMKRLATEGYNNVLLAGGPRLTSDFLRAGVVTDFYHTTEPMLFETGTPMLSNELSSETQPHSIALHLESYGPLNDRGTILAHYTFTKFANSKPSITLS